MRLPGRLNPTRGAGTSDSLSRKEPVCCNFAIQKLLQFRRAFPTFRTMSAKQNPVLTQPTDMQVPVWRYMDFTKYVSLLDSGALFLPRVDLLDDPFEGTFGKGIPPTEPIEIAGGQKSFVAVSDDHREGLRRLYRQLRNWTYVCCWHANEVESAAMWRLYSRTNEAVAIRTTYAALCKALPDYVDVGLVQYIDFESEWVPETNTLWPFFYKRESFEHEREVRVVLQDGKHGNAWPFRENEDLGKLVQVDLEAVVKAVIVAPTSPAWFRDLVSSVTSRYAYQFSVSQSSMDAEPVS